MAIPKFKLVEVRDAGKLDKERVFFKVNEDVDLGDYVLTDTTYAADGTQSNKLRHVYEFPTKLVEKGSFVSLYTKAGTAQLGTLDDEITPLHRMYWGLKETIWNKTGDKAFLLFAPKTHRQTLVVPAQK